LANAAFSWNDKLQHVVALSSAKGEYYAARAAVKEALWIREILREMRFPQKGLQKSIVIAKPK
jgi:hypothetical protein